MDNLALNRLVRRFEALLAGQRIIGVDAARVGVQLSLKDGPLCFSLLQTAPALFSSVQKASSEGGFSRIAGCLRGHCIGRTIRAVEKPLDDRRLRLALAGKDAELALWFEAIPRRVDLLLVDGDGTVLCSARDSGQEGSPYDPPAMGEGIDFFQAERGELINAVNAALEADDPNQVLRRGLRGADPRLTEELVAARREGAGELARLIDVVREGEYGLAIIGDDAPELLPDVYRASRGGQRFDDPAEAAAVYFRRRVRAVSLEQLRSALRSAISRRRKRIAAAEHKIDAEEKRIGADADLGRFGDLILANMHRIRRGMSSVEVENYYDEAGGLITIELDPVLSPSENAERYYVRARKARRGFKHIEQRRKELKREWTEVDAIRERTNEAVDDVKILRRLREELMERGWILSSGKRRERTKEIRPGRRFVSSDGFDIVIGRNNIDNERVTFGVGRENDFWLHAAGRAGSHVIVRNPARLEELPPAALAEAAALAAYYSKARSSANVQVHWTQRRFVRKIKGAEPGKVALTSYRSVIADPAIPPTVRVRE